MRTDRTTPATIEKLYHEYEQEVSEANEKVI